MDGLAGDSPQLVTAAAYLVGDLMRTFGQPDVLHITPQGQVAPARWRNYKDEWGECGVVDVGCLGVSDAGLPAHHRVQELLWFDGAVAVA